MFSSSAKTTEPVLDFVYCRHLSCDKGGSLGRLNADAEQAIPWCEAVDSLPPLPRDLSVDAHEAALTKSLHTHSRPFKQGRRAVARRPFVGELVRSAVAMWKHVRERMQADSASRTRLWCGLFCAFGMSVCAGLVDVWFTGMSCLCLRWMFLRP